jgi:hypothetical protein
MSFRLTAERTAGRVVLRVEGGLSSASVALLEAECREARARGDATVIELSGVRSLPDPAAQRLAALGNEGVELTGASGFVAALLRG